MLMDFQIDSGHMATAEIIANTTEVPHGRNSPTHEIRTFELSGSVWMAMFACYATFFSALFLATGRGKAAVFAIVVSVGYTIVYFGVGSILNRVSAPERATLPKVNVAGGMATQTGWMSSAAVNAQILVVPVSLVIFSCSFAIIRAIV